MNYHKWPISVNDLKYVFVINVLISFKGNIDEKRLRVSTTAISQLYSSECCRQLTNKVKKETKKAAAIKDLNPDG